MSEQNRTAPRWQDVPEAAQAWLVVTLGLLRSGVEDDVRTNPRDRVTGPGRLRALDAALARLAEPATAAEPVREVAASEHPCARRCWRIGAPAEIVDGVCAECSSPGRKREPTAAERWRAVPERARRIIVDDLTARAENEDGAAYALRDHAAASAWRREVAEAVRALLALAREAEGT